MSFSIPAAEDIGPQASSPAPSMDNLDGLISRNQLERSRSVSSLLSTWSLDLDSASPKSNGGSGAELAAESQSLAQRVGPNKRAPFMGSLGSILMSKPRHSVRAASQKPLGQQQGELSSLTIGQKSPLDGAIGDTGDKRDVISVGQCCSMVETEDVSVSVADWRALELRVVNYSLRTADCS